MSGIHGDVMVLKGIVGYDVMTVVEFVADSSCMLAMSAGDVASSTPLLRSLAFAMALTSKLPS